MVLLEEKIWLSWPREETLVSGPFSVYMHYLSESSHLKFAVILHGTYKETICFQNLSVSHMTLAMQSKIS